MYVKATHKKYKMSPLVLWTIREYSSDTLGVSPHVMVFARTPPNPLKLTKKSWTGEIQLPLGTAKSVTKYLTHLRAKLKNIHEYVDEHACAQQQKYVAYYDSRVCEKNLKVGDEVIVLLPDSSNTCRRPVPGRRPGRLRP